MAKRYIFSSSALIWEHSWVIADSEEEAWERFNEYEGEYFNFDDPSWGIEYGNWDPDHNLEVVEDIDNEQFQNFLNSRQENYQYELDFG